MQLICDIENLSKRVSMVMLHRSGFKVDASVTIFTSCLQEQPLPSELFGEPERPIPLIANV